LSKVKQCARQDAHDWKCLSVENEINLRLSQQNIPFGKVYPKRMNRPPIPEDLRRFVLTSVPSVPFLEALLLLRANPGQQWSGEMLAGRLYTSERTGQGLLDELCRSGMAARCPAPHEHCYCYAPASDALRERIDGLAELYARHLVDVTNLIHSTLDRKAQQFADAFRLRKDT
jgi:hypothetical protein